MIPTLVALLLGADPPPLMGTQPGGLAGHTPLADNVSCRECHDGNAVADDPTPYTPWDGWAATMMGNSIRDPLYQAAVTVAEQDSPGMSRYCLRCHSPAAYVRDHLTPPDQSAFDVIDRQGVSCEICHRSVVPAGVAGAPFRGNAQLYFEEKNVKHGPYDNVSSPAHDGLQNPFTLSGELCGQCHQVENPLVTLKDASGADTGRPFPLDTTYEEWKGSKFSADTESCHDCHMGKYLGDHAVARNGPLRTDPDRHTFVGANAWGLAAVLAANPDLAPLQPLFDAQRSNAARKLSEAAILSISVPHDPVSPNAHVKVHVTVTNLAGHKLPTGYGDGRRAFLQLTVAGIPVSGRYDEATGELVGDPQLRVYEAVHGRAGKGADDHLALHDTVVKDSRIPPEGFVASDSTRPTVSWFDDGAGGFKNVDVLDYDVVIPEGAGVTLRVEARLLYQTTTRRYVEFLAAENRTDAKGTALRDVWKATGMAAPLLVAKNFDVLTVRATAPTPSGCTCGRLGWILPAGLGLALSRRRSRSRPRPG